MINSKAITQLLTELSKPVTLTSVKFQTETLQSAVVVSSINGAILSYFINDQNDKSLNNLKMMSLLCKDKWSEDEQDLSQQQTTSCYSHEWQIMDAEFKTRIYTYEIEELHVCLTHLPESDLIVIFFADTQYPYGLLVMKMKTSLESFASLYGYKLS